jgi:hypothetical protein
MNPTKNHTDRTVPYSNKKFGELYLAGFYGGTNAVIDNSEHRKMRAKQQHVCKVMNQYMINTNRKWILSFGIERTIGVKYRK